MMSYIPAKPNTAVKTAVDVPAPPQRPLTPKGGGKKGSPRYSTQSISHFVSPSVHKRKVVQKRQRRARKKDTLSSSMREILFPDNQSVADHSEVSYGSYDLSERNYSDDEQSTDGLSGISGLHSASSMQMGEVIHKDPADNFLFMAKYRKNKKQYDRALAFYKKALKIRVDTVGPDHPDTVDIINEMAWILYQQKEYTKAMKKYQKALKIRIKALGWDHVKTAETYCHIANILQVQGACVGAMRVYQLVLAIRLKTLKRDDPDLCDTYKCIASVHYDLGEYEQSLKMYQRVWSIQFKNIGPEHLDTATTFYCIANVLKKQGKNENARTMYREALQIRKKYLGPDHPDTVKTQRLYEELL